jgi:hypothetical protein
MQNEDLDSQKYIEENEENTDIYTDMTILLA